MTNCCLMENLRRYLGRTVTIFTTSGGLSGSGFTGVLAYVDECCIKLITDIGAAPTCPIGNTCLGMGYGNGGGWNDYGFSGGWGMGYGMGTGYGMGYGMGFGGGCGCGGGYNNLGRNWLGSVTEIPICCIASFTHNAI